MAQHSPASPSVQRAYRALLLVYPSDVRRRFGDEMQQLFLDDWQANQRSPLPRSLVGMWSRTLRATLANAFLIRLRRVGRWLTSPTRTPNPRQAPTPSRTMRDAMDSLLQDVRYALRGLRRSPGFAAVAIVTLALVIGVNSAVFSLVDSVLIRALPYPEPDRLVRIWSADPGSGERFLEATFADFRAFQDRSRLLSEVAAFSLAPRDLNDSYGDPSTITIARVGGSLFGVIGIAPLLGRDFRPEELRGESRVAILSYGLWQSRYGGGARVLGQMIDVDQEPHVIVGVMPRTFAYPHNAELWRPFTNIEDQDDDRELQLIARLAPGSTVQQASHEAAAIADQIATELTGGGSKITAWVQPMHEMLVREARGPLLVLLGAVSTVLLIACANIANLLLARATVREREMTVRMALGASRGRLVRLLLTESVMLAVLGAAGGLVLGQWVLRAVVAASPANTPRIFEVTMDIRVLLTMLAVSVAAGVLFGLAPAWRVGRGSVCGLQASGRATNDAPKHGFQRVLVVAEVGMSTVLLAVAALLIVSFARLMEFDRGFAPNGVLTMNVHLPEDVNAAASTSFFRMLEDHVTQLPEVRAVGLSSHDPTSTLGFRGTVRVVGEPANPKGQLAYARVVTPTYFDAMGVELRKGHTFSSAPTEASAREVVVNEAFVRAFLASDQSIGRSFTMPFFQLPVEIAGIVADIQPEPETPALPAVYLSADRIPLVGMVLVVRSEANPLQLVGAIRQQIWASYPSIPLDRIATIEQTIADSMATPRFNSLLVGSFAGLALLLAAIGVYGVMAYTVEQRVREIGLRQALGATVSGILGLVVWQGVKLTATGIAVGLGAALAVTRLLETMLFDVSPTDPVTFALVALILAAVSIAATIVPARRAVRIDPMRALRGE